MHSPDPSHQSSLEVQRAVRAWGVDQGWGGGGAGGKAGEGG